MFSQLASASETWRKHTKNHIKMMKIVAVICCLAAVCHGYSVVGGGPSNNVAGTTCDAEGKFAVDETNMCWYHECVLNFAGLQWLPRRCAWMSKVSSNYVEGVSNPCTVRIGEAERLTENPCKRKMAAVAGPPACHPTTCQNGGTPVYESNLCWCECPPSWQGDHDCSRPTMNPSGLPPSSNICVDGAPGDDWCDNVGGCLNGGTCHNQCDTFWCDCGEVSALSADHVGKRCEINQIHYTTTAAPLAPETTTPPPPPPHQYYHHY